MCRARTSPGCHVVLRWHTKVNYSGCTQDDEGITHGRSMEYPTNPCTGGRFRYDPGTFCGRKNGIQPAVRYLAPAMA
jgi:hypothetical protein